MTKWQKRRRRICTIIDIGSTADLPSRVYDIFFALTIIINLIASTAYTFDMAYEKCGTLLLWAERVTVLLFALDYILRLWTAEFRFDGLSSGRAALKYAVTLTGIIDLLSFLPYYLPFFFPAGAAAFRMFRVIRIFRLFRINAYYDSLNVITEVISSKKQQLMSSVFIILVLMLASSLCMYSVEHEAQPEVFQNAFSGIWWSVSTLLTIGYGDIYPITPLGKLCSIIITFLGVGMVAIPTGIISAGFVDQYSRIKRMSEYGRESDVSFMKIQLTENDAFVGREIRGLGLPENMIVAVIQRGDRTLVPRGDVVLQAGDILVIGAETMDGGHRIELKEVVLQSRNPWTGCRIRDLDISRQTLIVLVRRKGKALIPKGSLVLQEGDCVILFTQSHIPHAESIQV